MYNVVETKKTKIGRFNIVQDNIKKNDIIYPYSYIEFKDGVCVIPFVDEGHVLLLKEYRHAIKQWVYNFPGGMIDDNEAIENAVNREMIEETGYCCEKLIDLGYTYPSFGSTTEKIYLFATFVKKIASNKKEALEFIEEIIVPVEKIEEMIRDSSLVQGAGQVAWLKWKMYLEKTDMS